MVRGRDLINPMRHLSDTTMMVPGLLLQFDVAGPFLVKTKSKQAALETRQERKELRTTIKIRGHDDWSPVRGHSGHFYHQRLGHPQHFD